MRDLRTWLAAAIGVLAPAEAAMVTALALILVDGLCKIILAIRDHSISLKMVESLVVSSFNRALLYEIAIILGYCVGEYLIGPGIPVFNMITGVIGLAEIQTILSSITAISGDSVFSPMLERLSPKRPTPPEETSEGK